MTDAEVVITGTDILGALLLADNAFKADVAEDQIKAGALAEDAPLPAVLLRVVSTTERQTLKRQGATRTRDRVSVTVRTESYRQQKMLIKRIRTICAGKVGDIGGGKAVSILTAGTGPDLDGPNGSFERTQDFFVSFDA